MQCGWSPDHQESQWPAVSLPAPVLAPSWVAMQRLSLSQATALHHHADAPGTHSGAERRTSAKCPPSLHPISWPPPAAEDALPNQEPGLPHRPPTPYWWRVNLPVLPSDWAARTLPPIPSNVATCPGSRHPCPSGPPLPRQDPTSIRQHHPLASITPEKRNKDIATSCPWINVPAVKTNFTSSRQHLFLINAVTLP